jgi:hypothetical protein
VSPEGLTKDPGKLKAIQEWLMRDKHELRSFLDLCTYYYRQFISSFADIANLLTTLTEEKQAFQCPLKVEATFHSLKETIRIAPLLSYPRLGKQFLRHE